MKSPFESKACAVWGGITIVAFVRVLALNPSVSGLLGGLIGAAIFYAAPIQLYERLFSSSEQT